MPDHVSNCSIDADSEERARIAGARLLGVSPADVKATRIEEGNYRVQLLLDPGVIEVEIADDRMEARVSCMTPVVGNHPPRTRKDVIRVLNENGVTTGIEEKVIDELVAAVAQGVVKKDVVVARGREPRRGEDAIVTRHYLKDGEPCRSLVRNGEVLIEREPATPGETGCTVMGDVLPPDPCTDDPIEVGEGLACDKKKTRWTAKTAGFGYLELDDEGRPRLRPAVWISKDRFQAFLDLRGPGAGEKAVEREELDAAIRAAHVVTGLQRRRIDAVFQAVAAGRSPGRPIRIAFGTRASPGRDARVEVLIDVEKSVGKVDEKTGQVDFRERNITPNARKGQHIGTWIPAATGTDGMGVDGTKVTSPVGKEAELLPAEGVETRELEDGRIEILAARDGVVLFPQPNQIVVTDLLEIKGDVDYETGNIDASGCVVVKGTVRSGFRVTAKYHIHVSEGIEAAVVKAGTDLIVGLGIIGDEHSLVSAERLVSIEFAQNARIRCGGDVEIRNSAMNSTIECRGRIVATEKAGRLRGGRYNATNGLIARELGSELGAPTSVCVGMNHEVMRKLAEVRGEIEEVKEEAGERMRGTENPAEPRSEEELVRAVKLLKAHRRRLEELAFASEPPTVEVLGLVYPGVRIQIRDTAIRVDETLEAVRYRYVPSSEEIEFEAAGKDQAA
ncbi:MAG: FapA family protein [Planctomycetota bacterium]|nr:FapA family protein [Planctomycetota bacterium]